MQCIRFCFGNEHKTGYQEDQASTCDGCCVPLGDSVQQSQHARVLFKHLKGVLQGCDEAKDREVTQTRVSAQAIKELVSTCQKDDSWVILEREATRHLVAQMK